MNRVSTSGVTCFKDEGAAEPVEVLFKNRDDVRELATPWASHLLQGVASQDKSDKLQQKIWSDYETKEKALASGSRSRFDIETGTFEEASSNTSMISLQPISTGSASLQEGNVTEDQVRFHSQFVEETRRDVTKITGDVRVLKGAMEDPAIKKGSGTVKGTIGDVDPIWRPGTQTAKSTEDSDAVACIMSLAELQDTSLQDRKSCGPKGVDPSKREMHLSDE